jgi:alpha-ketoglutarate-dependent taurine dioxygenase
MSSCSVKSCCDSTLRLDPQTQAALLTRILPTDHPRASWPTQGVGSANQSLAAHRAHILEHIYGNPGWVLLDTGLDPCDDSAVISGAWNLFASLFTAVPQYRTGEMVHLVEVSSASTQAASYYSQSNTSGAYHTDGTLLDVTPDVAMLAGIQTADTGGETVLIDALRVMEHLAKEEPQYLRALTERHPFHSGGPEDPVVFHPILDTTSGSPRVRYMRRYVELGYAHTGRLIPELLRESLQALDETAQDSRREQSILITRGRALIWDNTRHLHGRRSFTELRRRRRLLRTYGMSPS